MKNIILYSLMLASMGILIAELTRLHSTQIAVEAYTHKTARLLFAIDLNQMERCAEITRDLVG